MSAYSLGIPLGKLVGMVIGGVVAQTLGWRVAFIAVGLPGVALAVLAWFTLPRPPKRTHIASRGEPFSVMFRDLLRVRTFWWISFGAAFMSFFSYGQSAFIGSFFIRVHGLSVAEAGVALGVSLGLAGALGTWLGGTITDRAAQLDRRAYVRFPALAAVAGGATFLVAMLLTNPVHSLVMLAVAALFNSIWYGPIFATVQGLVPPARRATAAAVHLLILNLIGLGFGPLIFGAVSDLLNHGWALGSFTFEGVGPKDGLKYALLLGSSFAALAVFCFLRAARTLDAEMEAL